MQKNSKKIILISFIFFVLGAISGYSYVGSKDTIVNDDSIYQEREINSSYKFINPLIECEVKTLGSQQKYIPFERELKERIQTNIINTHPDIQVSYYFRNLRNGPWFGYREEEAFSPASLMKLPVGIAYMKWVEENPAIWGQSLTGIAETNSFQNITPGQSIIAGNQYNIDELIRYALIYSDNNANTTLIENIPTDLLFRVFRELNVPIIDELNEGEDEYISVKEYASFFRILFNSSYLSRTSSEYLLRVMSLAENERGIKKRLPKDVIVSHKFGERGSIDKKTGLFMQQFHDCGIVYYESYPYLLCVMTKGTSGFESLETIIEDISLEIFNTVRSTYEK